MKAIKLLLLLILISGCTDSGNHETQVTRSAKVMHVEWTENDIIRRERFTVVIIDSCEYLISEQDRSRNITHKGNCRFCAAKNK